MTERYFSVATGVEAFDGSGPRDVRGSSAQLCKRVPISKIPPNRTSCADRAEWKYIFGPNQICFVINAPNLLLFGFLDDFIERRMLPDVFVDDTHNVFSS